MSFLPQKWSRTGLVLGVCLLLGGAPFASAQKVPISFNDFHGYTGTVDYIKKVAGAYPDITELLEIGKSNMGRSQYVLVITNMKTGTTIDKHVKLRNMRKENVQNVTPMKPYQGKPGQWIDGGTHGNEYTGTEVCLYIIDKLVSGYGADPEIKKLIDDNVFYICPIVNPDGVYNSVEAEISQRQNSMMVDNDNDGRFNEDGPDDLNGDGHITSFRYKDPEGRYVIDDVDPRIMVRLGRDEETTRERYAVITEDKDNDGDGKRGEDSERGIDVNRNFPEGWFKDDGFQGGSGFYPSSAPESHAILEFFTNHTNILMVQSFHTSGGFTYRPFARWPDSRIAAKDLAVFDRIMGKKYLELYGEEIPEAWKEPAPSASRTQRAAAPAQQRGGARTAAQAPRTRAAGGAQEMPRLWRYPYRGDRPYGYGIFIDWAYAEYGSYSMTTELWNRFRDMKGIPPIDEQDEQRTLKLERAALKLQDDAFGGRFFVPWKRYKHPELGEGEIGGWIRKYWGGNAFPGESLTGVCDIHWQFELFKAALLPHVAITDAAAEVMYTTNSAREATAVKDGDTVTIRKGGTTGKYKIVKVTASIANTGKLATHVARGANLAGNRQDAVWLIGDRDKITFLQGTPFMRLGVLDGVMEIPGVESGETPGAQGAARQTMRNMPPGMPPQMMQQFRQRGGGQQQAAQTGSTREVTWLVAIEGDSPLKIVVTSQKGGTAVKELTIR